MYGSGLKEALYTIYTPNSVDKMLAGHAYVRAIRGHFQVQLALSNIVFSSIDFTDIERTKLDILLTSLGTEKIEEELDNEELKLLYAKYPEHLKKLNNDETTSEFVMEYMEIVHIVKDFIRAERTGNFKLHCDTM